MITERESSAQGMAQEKHFPKPLTRKTKRAVYCEFLQTAELKDGSFRSLPHGRYGGWQAPMEGGCAPMEAGCAPMEKEGRGLEVDSMV